MSADPFASNENPVAGPRVASAGFVFVVTGPRLRSQVDRDVLVTVWARYAALAARPCVVGRDPAVARDRYSYYPWRPNDGRCRRGSILS